MRYLSCTWCVCPPERWQLLAFLVGAMACGTDGGEGWKSTGEAEVETPDRTGAYAISDGLLYRVEAESLVALVALPGSGPAADTATGCISEIPELGQNRFRRLTLSPDSGSVVWETDGPGVCVGVLAAASVDGKVLARWTQALPDTVLWAPSGRYVAVWLRHAGRRHSVEVFDADIGRRLTMPWEEECARSEQCDVQRAGWVGGTLLDVDIRLGPGEQALPFEVNVSSPAGEPEEEIAE